MDGTNADDLSDVRPGRAAARRHGVLSPLAELGFTKEEIRQASLQIGLCGFDRPASPCLSSRIAYGIPVTIERLSKVERSEAHLRSLGFREFRVRVHGDLARVEIAADELRKALDPKQAENINTTLKSFGFKFITLDLEGFRSGSLNSIGAGNLPEKSTLEIN